MVEQAGSIIKNTIVQAPKNGFKKSWQPKVITPKIITKNRHWENADLTFIILFLINSTIQI